MTPERIDNYAAAIVDNKTSGFVHLTATGRLSGHWCGMFLFDCARAANASGDELCAVFTDQAQRTTKAKLFKAIKQLLNNPPHGEE